TLATIQSNFGEGGDGTPIEFTTNGGSFTNPSLYLDSVVNGQRVGIGTATPVAQLDVHGLSVNSVASFSGTTLPAAFIVDQSGTGDIFTASKSGSTKFTIT